MEDAILIDRYLSGDQEGFTMLVKKYQNQIVNIVYSLTGQAQSAADDIAQEIFIKVYHNLRSFRKKAQFSTWLYRITINTTYNYLQKEKKHTPSDYIEEADVFQRNSSDEVASRERQELIRGALERLPFKFRSTIVLKEIEGLSYKEIAKTLGCRIGTVESRLFRAREMLRKILSPILKEGTRDELR